MKPHVSEGLERTPLSASHHNMQVQSGPSPVAGPKVLVASRYQGCVSVQAMCRDYYTLDFVDAGVDTAPIAPELARFFDDVLDSSVARLNFKAIVDGLGGVLFQYPFRCVAGAQAKALRDIHPQCGQKYIVVSRPSLAGPRGSSFAVLFNGLCVASVETC